MLLHKILQAITTIGIKSNQIKFNSPPKETYLIYFDSKQRGGADLKNFITRHEIRFEVYSYDFQDEDKIYKISNILEKNAIEYTQFESSFIDSENLFLTVFEFSFTEKQRQD